MEAPFVFGKLATEENFTDRIVETEYLVQNFKALTNTILISPRRWGKSSLVNKAAGTAMEQDPRLRVCHIDLFNVRDEQDFYGYLAQSVLRATSSRLEEVMDDVRRFFNRLIPRVSIGTDPTNEISLDFDWEEVRENPDEVLELAERIAVEKNIKIVVCVDEFQNIAEFADSDSFQKKLRAFWQRHQHVAYCLYGSKRHMMLDVFSNSSKPFYKFGNLLFLNKIETDCYVDFFKSRYQSTGKDITDDAARLIVRLVDNHPYYAQQLAQLAWFRTDKLCDEKIVSAALDSLVEQLSLLFITLTEKLTTQQLNLLHALINREESLTSTSVMNRYHISSTTSVTRSKAALIKNDILDNVGNTLKFQDPIYETWLRTVYFH